MEIQERIDKYVSETSPINQKGIKECLENPYRIIERMRCYVLAEAKRKKLEPWSIVGNITGNGSGYSNAIWEVLIKENPSPEGV